MYIAGGGGKPATGKCSMFLNNVYNLKSNIPLPQVTLTDFGDAVQTIWFACSNNIPNHLFFQRFDFKCIWWRCFQKLIVCTQLHITFLLHVNIRVVLKTFLWLILRHNIATCVDWALTIHCQQYPVSDDTCNVWRQHRDKIVCKSKTENIFSKCRFHRNVLQINVYKIWYLISNSVLYTCKNIWKDCINRGGQQFN